MWNDGLQCVASRFGIIEVANFVALQSHRKFMKVFGHLMIVVEALIEIRFAITISVSQNHQLVPAGDVDIVGDDLDTKRLE